MQPPTPSRWSMVDYSGCSRHGTNWLGPCPTDCAILGGVDFWASSDFLVRGPSYSYLRLGHLWKTVDPFRDSSQRWCFTVKHRGVTKPTRWFQRMCHFRSPLPGYGGTMSDISHALTANSHLASVGSTRGHVTHVLSPATSWGVAPSFVTSTGDDIVSHIFRNASKGCGNMCLHLWIFGIYVIIYWKDRVDQLARRRIFRANYLSATYSRMASWIADHLRSLCIRIFSWC